MSERNYNIESNVMKQLQGKKDFQGMRGRTKAVNVELHADTLESLDDIGRALPNLEWLGVTSERLKDVRGFSS